MDLMPDDQLWSQTHTALWQRIARHDFEPPTALNFTQRLARDKHWSLDESRAAIDEYRRFCFLACVSPTTVTPSEAVDEVWHQHLIYSRDYWDAWCSQVLLKKLHHDPTPGGAEAGRRYRTLYAETLALYERYFGPPDPALWPGTNARFGPRPRFQTIDTHRDKISPRRVSRLARFVFWNKGT